MRLTRGIGVISLLLIALRAQAETPQTVRQVEPTLAPLAERVATYLGNGDWRRVRVPGAEPAPQGWLYAWTQRLQAELQPARLQAGPVASPLLQRPLKLVRIGQRQPGLATEVPWSELNCATGGGQLRLDVIVLHVTDPGEHWLGIDLGCQRGATWLRSARLVVQTLVDGRVRSAGGVWTTAAQPAGEDPVPRPRWQPTGKRWQWPHAAGALLDLAVPVETPTDEAGSTAPQRLLWWLDLEGLPQQALLDGETTDKPALTLPPQLMPWLEAELALAPLAHEAPHGPTWTHGAMAAWHLRAGRWQQVPVKLPVLNRDGLWTCEPLDAPALRCSFHGQDLVAGVVELTLPWRDGQYAPDR